MRLWRILAYLWLVTFCGPVGAAERVVTLAPHLAELVCAVGACERLVGVAEYSNAPAQVAGLPKVGNAYAANFEAVLALRPDWVLLWDGGTPPEIAQRLRELGLRVDGIAIRSLDDIGLALMHVGRGLGSPQPAAEAAGAYRARLEALRARYRDRPRLRAFFQIETAPAYTINRRSPIHEAMALCGADNVFADLPALAGAISTEAVIAARPEVVVTTSDENAAAIAAYWVRFPQLDAAQYRVVVRADALTRQSPAVLEGIAELCEGLDRVRAERLSRGAR